VINHKRKIALGMLTGTLPTIIGVISAIMTVPLFIHAVGRDDYGLFLVVSSVIGFISLTDFGITPAVTNQISFLVAEKRHSEISDLFSSGVSLFSLIILLIWVVLGVLFFTKIISMQFLFGIKDVQVIKATYIFFILLFFHSANILFGAIFQSLFFGLNEIPRYNILNSIYLIVYSTGFIIFLFFQPSIISIAIFQGLFSAIKLVMLILVGKLSFKWLKVSLRVSLIKKVFPLLKHSIVFVWLSICNSLIGRTDLLVISHILGVGAAPIYNITNRIFVLPATFFQFADPAQPSVAIEYKNNNIPVLQKLYTQVVRMHMIVRIAVLSFILFFSKELISLWVGKDFFQGYLLVAIFFLSVIIYSWVGPHFVFINAMFKQKVELIPLILSAIINLVLSIILARKIGLLGVVLGTVVGNMLTTVFYLPYYLKKQIPIRPFYELRKIIFSFLIPFCCLFLLYYVSRILYGNLFIWVPYFILSLCIYALIVFFVVFEKNERVYFINKFFQIWGAFKNKIKYAN